MTALYIAGTYNEVDRAHRARRAARDAGFIVTSTWPESIAKVGDANPADASVVDRCHWSTTCLAEVQAADALWFLVPTPPIVTRGAWVEVGYANAFARHLVFSGLSTHQSVFCALGEEFVDDESALFHLRAWSADRRLQRGLREIVENAPVATLLPGPGESG